MFRPVLVPIATLLIVAASAIAAAVDVSSGLPGKLRIVAAVPGQSRVLAFCGEGYGPATIWYTIDAGKTWAQLGQGTGSARLTIQPLGILFDPASPDSFWVFGNFAGVSGGALRTRDGGNTFVGLRCEEAEGLSVDFSDPQRRTLLIGRHEQSQKLFKSTDGGATWTNIGTPLPTNAARSEYPLVIDAQTSLVGCSFTIPYGPGSTGGTPGIYRTTDGGKTWTLVSPAAAFQSPLVVGKTIYWTCYNPKTQDGALLASDDKGLTWKTLIPSGLNHAVMPMALPDGQIAVLRRSRALTVSADSGASWSDTTASTTLRDPAGVTYSSAFKAYFAWQVNGPVQRIDIP